jgi:hypothetical protein
MLNLIAAIPYTLAALLAVTILCSLGAVASRVFNFNFAYLSILSFTVYILIGYFVGGNANLSTAILSSLIVGFYDATVGWKISLKLKANMGINEELLDNITVSKALTIMLFVAPFFAFIGHLFR